jgi:hypothetical protein
MTDRDRDARELHEQFTRQHNELTHMILHAVDDFVDGNPDEPGPDVVLTGIIGAMHTVLAGETCPGCREKQRQMCNVVFALAVAQAMKAPTTEHGEHHLN